MSQSINVQIRASANRAESTVGVSGCLTHTVTQDERRKLFAFTDDQIRSAIKKWFGKKPDDIFFHGPTPWNNLYKTNEWDEVSTTIMPSSARIVSVLSLPVDVTTRTYKNDNQSEEKVEQIMSGTFESSVRSAWSCHSKKTLGALKPHDGEEVKYEVRSVGVSGTKKTTTFSRGLGTKQKQKSTCTIGPEQPVGVRLKANEKKTVSLVGRRSIMKVKISYQAYLTGFIAVNYHREFRGQNFWAFDIESVLAAAGIRNLVTFEETIELDHMVNAHVAINGHSDQRLPVSALSVGPAVLTTKKVVKKRVRSLQSLKNVADQRGYFGEGPKIGSILNMTMDPICSMPPVSSFNNASVGSKGEKPSSGSSVGSVSTSSSSKNEDSRSASSSTSSSSSVGSNGSSSYKGDGASFPPMNAKSVATCKRDTTLTPVPTLMGQV